jgi:hypothetical protein
MEQDIGGEGISSTRDTLEPFSKEENKRCL